MPERLLKYYRPYRKTLFFALVLTIMAAYIFRYEMPRLEVEKEQAAPFAGITARAITSNAACRTGSAMSARWTR